jgi:hypothetical protein
MADYQSAENMPYGAWVNRQAALEGIQPSDLEKQLIVQPVRVTGFKFITDARVPAIEQFNAQVANFDAVTDLQEGIVYFDTVLGCRLGNSYRISGTAIKKK